MSQGAAAAFLQLQRSLLWALCSKPFLQRFAGICAKSKEIQFGAQHIVKKEEKRGESSTLKMYGTIKIVWSA